MGLGRCGQESRDAMKPTGPRVIVKTDAESPIGRGCVLYGAHFRPEIALIVWAACRTTHHIDEIRLTEGWRPSGDKRDLHPELRALDIVATRGGERLSLEEHKMIVMGMRRWLNPDYQFRAHDAGSGVHIHVELDPQ